MNAANSKKKICQRFPINADGHFSNIQLVVDTLSKYKPGLSRKRANAIVSKYVTSTPSCILILTGYLAGNRKMV